jgi:hypothetical protein
MRSLYNHKNLVSLVAALLFLSNIFVFGPIFIYQGNLTGFIFYLPLKLMILLIPFFVLLFIFTFLGAILSEKAHKLFISILTSLGILMWVQGTFLVWNLGVLDGSFINWTKGAWRGFVDGAIWIIFIGVAIAARRRFYKLSLYAGILILVSQVVMVCVVTFQKPQIWYRRTQAFTTPPKEVFQFSNKQNVLHIILDQFGSTLFTKMLQENSSYQDALEGFTFFKEVTTSSHVTFISVPSFLSGKKYTNKMPVAEYYDENYKKNNIQTELHQTGYDLDIVSQPTFLEKRDIDSYYYNIPTPYSTKTSLQISVYRAAFLLDLSLFRGVPYFLKKLVYNNQSWLISALVLPEKDSKFEHFSANEFLGDFITYASIERNNPVYKYIHLNTPHPPLVVNSKHKFAGKVLSEKEPVFFQYQAEYTLKKLFRFLKKLKALDIYNSTLIIVQSDHGSGIPFNLMFSEGITSSNESTIIPSDAFLPLLLIKKPFEQGKLKTSNAQGELTDLPATICSILNIQNNFPGQSLYDIDTSVDRRRTGYYSSVTDRNDAMITGFFEGFQEYIITGSVLKYSSWAKGVMMNKPAQPYMWGAVLNFIDKGNINSFLDEGWGLPEGDNTWTTGKNASLRLPIKAPHADMIELSCIISPFLVSSKGLVKQHLEISINNSTVGKFSISAPGKQKVSLLFPKKLVENSSEMLVSFSMPDATVGTKVGIKGEERMLGFAFSSISFSEH